MNRIEYHLLRFEFELEFNSSSKILKILGRVRIKTQIRTRLEVFEHVRELFENKGSRYVYLTYNYII